MVQKRGSRRYSSKRKRTPTNNGEAMDDTNYGAHQQQAVPVVQTQTDTTISSPTVAYFWNHSTTSESTSTTTGRTDATTHATGEKEIPLPPFTIDEFADAVQLLPVKRTDSYHNCNNYYRQLIFSVWDSIKTACCATTGSTDSHNDGSCNALYHPTPIQLQAWSILLSVSPTTLPVSEQQQHQQQEEEQLDSHFHNAILIAPTGSGKTYAYGVPMIVRCVGSSSSPSQQGPIQPQRQRRQQQQQIFNDNLSFSSSGTSGRRNNLIEGIVLVPTRELAIQVQTSLSFILAACTTTTTSTTSNRVSDAIATAVNNISIVALYGGQCRTIQSQQLQTATIVTATSGRLLDLLTLLLDHPQPDSSTFTTTTTTTTYDHDHGKNRNSLSFFFPRLHTIVIDEADRMAIHTDLHEQTKQILSLISLSHDTNPTTGNYISASSQQPKQQTQQQSQPPPSPRLILCSATWPDRATTIWNDWIRDTTGYASSTIVVTVDAMSIKTSKRKRGNKDDELIELNESQQSTNTIVNDETRKYGADQINTSKEKETPMQSFIVSRIPSHLIQTLHVCAEHKKMKKLLHTIDIMYPINKNRIAINDRAPLTMQCNKSGIIFFNKIKTVEYMHHFVTKERPHLNKNTMILHSQLHQSQRERVWNQFVQHGSNVILFATDVAARGIHTPDIQFIINYDFPSNIEQYIHRCGRAGRNNQKNNTPSTNKNNAIQTNEQNRSAEGESARIEPLPVVAPTIYSFFTRNLSPLANDMIQLLESNGQFIDPNLRALVVSKKKSKELHNDAKPRFQHDDTVNPSDRCDGEVDNANFDDDEDDPFLQQLSPQRIVLSRDSNISDASSSDSDELENA